MFLDWELAKVLENHVRSKAANVITDVKLAAFIGENGGCGGRRRTYRYRDVRSVAAFRHRHHPTEFTQHALRRIPCSASRMDWRVVTPSKWPFFMSEGTPAGSAIKFPDS